MPATICLAVAAAAFWLSAPGLALGWALGLRGWNLAALAPPLSCALAGAASLAAPALGWAWGPAPVLALTAAASALTWAWGRFGGRPSPPGVFLARCRRSPARCRRSPGRFPRSPRRPGGGWIAPVAAAVGSAAGFGLGWGALRTVGAIPQGWDALFHGNLVRFIVETGNASPWHAGTLNAPAAESAYYPSTLHAIAALAPAQAQVWPALNMVLLVASSAVWVSGAVYLAGVLFPGRPPVQVAAALAAVTVQSGPAGLPDLMSNALALALAPGLVGFGVRLCQDGARCRPGAARSAVALALGLAGLAGAHPGGVLSWALLIAPFAVRAWWKGLSADWRAGLKARSLVRLAAPPALGIPLAVAVYGSGLVRQMIDSGGVPKRLGPLAALIEGWSDGWSLDAFRPNLLIMAGTAAALVWAVRQRRARLAASGYLLALGVFTASAADLAWLKPITGLWYSDPHRLAGTVAVMAAPLAGAGLVALAAWAKAAWPGGAPRLADGARRGARGAWRWAPRRHGTGGRPELGQRPAGPGWSAGRRLGACGLALALSAALAAGAVAGAALPGRLYAERYELFDQPRSDRFFTAPELAMMRRLPGELEPGAMVLGNPASGAGYLYSITGIEVAFPHMTGSWGASRQALLDQLDPPWRLGAGEQGPPRCLPDVGLPVRYLYVSRSSYRRWSLGSWDSPGDRRAGWRRVDSDGGGAVYELPTCEPGELAQG
ncbi:MAG: hypothetical protein LBG60_01265 [Bifidobacteriaceae bacterium]|nr:hypothetical protein [Bifidobacteriaceae bacterium]